LEILFSSSAPFLKPWGNGGTELLGLAFVTTIDEENLACTSSGYCQRAARLCRRWLRQVRLSCSGSGGSFLLSRPRG